MSLIDHPHTMRGHAAMLGATVLISTSFPVGAAITHGLDSLVLTGLRFSLAALLFAPIVAWRYGLRWPSLGALVRYSVLSACLVGFFWAMFTLHPAITASVAAILLHERMRSAARVALPVGLVGAVWVIFRGDLDALLGLELGEGDLIFLAGTVAMGFYGPLVKRFHMGEPMAVMTFWTLVTGAVWLLILSAPRLATVSWSGVAPSVYLGIAYLAVFTTLITFFIVQWSSTVIGPTKVASYTYLNPILVVGIGLVLGDGLPPLATYPGFVLILAALVVVLRARAHVRVALD